jgi:hypothetical protein
VTCELHERDVSMRDREDGREREDDRERERERESRSRSRMLTSRSRKAHVTLMIGSRQHHR